MWDTLTNQFAVVDVGFWKGGCQLPCNSPLHLLIQADSVTLKIINQKNGRMVQTIHHDSFASNLCPCKALARRIHHILANGGITELYICEYRVTSKDPFATVTPTDLIIAIQFSVSAHNSVMPPLARMWCEYTAPCYVQRRDGTLMWVTLTNQFAVVDVGFWKGGCQLPCNSPLHLLIQADSVTLKIINQKNGRMVQTIHHDSFASNLCPCKALARRIHHILANGGITELYICEYRVTSKDPFATVTPTDLIIAIQFSVSAHKLHHAGINPDLVGVHSLRAGGEHISEA